MEDKKETLKKEFEKIYWGECSSEDLFEWVWEKLHPSTKQEQRQHLTDLMKTDQDYGVYDHDKIEDEAFEYAIKKQIDRDKKEPSTTAEEILKYWITKECTDEFDSDDHDSFAFFKDSVLKAMEEYKNSGNSNK
jgi:hypothetical protein